MSIRTKPPFHIFAKTSTKSMSQKLSYFLFLFLCFSLNTFLTAQSQNDSLAKYSYEELHNLIRKYQYDLPDKSKIYSKEYLKRAKFDDDKVRISRGYFYLADYYVESDNFLAIKYTDSIIEICEDCEHEKYPALGYYFKGYLYSLSGKKENLALDNFLKALEFLGEKRNVELEFNIRTAIISIQTNWLSNEQSLNFTKESLDFVITNKRKIDRYQSVYLTLLHNLSIGYILNKKHKKGLEVANIGILEAKKSKDTLEYFDFISLAGEAHYYLANYKIAIDSLEKALPYRNDHGKAMNNYYLGKSYDKLKQPEKAHFHFLKTDFIYQATKDIFPEMRNVYEHIIDYYKSKNDTENQIKYYDLLLETDKVIDSTYTYVKETIEKKFDTPQAIAERARLVAALETKKNAWKYRFGAISAILLVILGILVAAFRRQKYYKKRFENLMVQGNDSSKDISTALNVTSEKQKNQTKNIDVPKEIVDNILNQLKKFEETKKFTKQVSITSLAKKLGTNPKYLSKVINWHYKKNFSHYISELRIEYVISRLKEDSKFRNYTIKAIAKEAGFGNTESFSKAFHKSTGIKPSYFIKELQKRLEG